MAKFRGLGLKGKDLLLKSTPNLQEKTHKVHLLDVEKLLPGQYQPRETWDEASLQELADSIAQQGILQPLLVRPLSDTDAYEIIAGERRYRAAQLANLSQVPCLIKELDNEQALAIALIENLQREDLSWLEEAKSLARLQEEFDLSHEEIAQMIGKSRSAVTNSLRLLKLDESVQMLLNEGQITMGHARALLAVEPLEQIALANEIIDRKLNVRAVEEIIRHRRENIESKQEKSYKKPNIDQAWLDKLSEKLGTKAEVKPMARGRYRLMLSFETHKDLEAWLEKFD